MCCVEQIWIAYVDVCKDQKNNEEDERDGGKYIEK